MSPILQVTVFYLWFWCKSCDHKDLNAAAIVIVAISSMTLVINEENKRRLTGYITLLVSI